MVSTSPRVDFLFIFKNLPNITKVFTAAQGLADPSKTPLLTLVHQTRTSIAPSRNTVIQPHEGRVQRIALETKGLYLVILVRMDPERLLEKFPLGKNLRLMIIEKCTQVKNASLMPPSTMKNRVSNPQALRFLL